MWVFNPSKIAAFLDSAPAAQLFRSCVGSWVSHAPQFPQLGAGCWEFTTRGRVRRATEAFRSRLRRPV